MPISRCLAFLLVCAQLTASQKTETVSSTAGSTQSFDYPPPKITVLENDPNFKHASALGHAGPTRAGDAAAAIATAPTFGAMDNIFPLVKPKAFDAESADAFDVISQFGGLQPWKSVPSKVFGLGGASPVIPNGCDITQVHLVHRHGARYPTGPTSGPAQFAQKVHEKAKSGFQVIGDDLQFLESWTYKLGDQSLTPFGEEELFELGVGFRVRYGALLKKFEKAPVFRTTSQDRVLDSALNFAAGFFGLRQFSKGYNQLIEIEDNGFTSTLTPRYSCNNAMSKTSKIKKFRSPGNFSGTWNNEYVKKSHARLSPLFPGFDLQPVDVFNMQQVCAYETVALGYSKFCQLFTVEDWKGFSYSDALYSWYGSGPGNPTTAAQGVGWVRELISRLTGERIKENSEDLKSIASLNKTIVTSPILFPLDQPIYVDATHDTVLSAIYVAMNFTSLFDTHPLPTDKIPSGLIYNTAATVPFASNLVGQVLACDASKPDKSTHIRWILNDGVLPLDGIKGCGTDKDGKCDLKVFIGGMQQRVKEIDFPYACNGTYDFQDNITNGQPPKKQGP